MTLAVFILRSYAGGDSFVLSQRRAPRGAFRFQSNGWRPRQGTRTRWRPRLSRPRKTSSSGRPSSSETRTQQPKPTDLTTCSQTTSVSAVLVSIERKSLGPKTERLNAGGRTAPLWGNVLRNGRRVGTNPGIRPAYPLIGIYVAPTSPFFDLRPVPRIRRLLTPTMSYLPST